ncbi:hypothetical protein ABZX92_08280 [Lentzea sp. NPDC006480]|uniref:hypothetical protein n=1 Tax=Lentzea sp. NPDC006480 TaxID=3157176 RepID=UPI0033B93679
MNRSLILVTAAAAALALSACTSTPAPHNDAAPPSTTSASTQPPAVATEVVTQTVTNTPAAPAKPVIGSFGYGPLKLGMTLQQVMDTKLIGPDRTNGGETCTSHEILGTGQFVWVSKAKGLASITFSPAMSSDGVGVGATEAKLKAEYTNLEPIGPNYSYVAKADNNPAAKFVFGVLDGKVTAAFLTLNGQDCHN